jgi:hypothetical protein
MQSKVRLIKHEPSEKAACKQTAFKKEAGITRPRPFQA